MANKPPRKPKKLNPIAKAISDLAAGAIPGSAPKPPRNSVLDPPPKKPSARKPAKAAKPKA
jgi:hypothetical protein